MNYQEFKKRVNYNTKLLEDTQASGENLINVASKFYTGDSKPDTMHFGKLIGKLYDIIPSIYLGALARLDRSGADAFIVRSDQSVEHLEIKTGSFASTKVWKGPQLGLNIGLSNKKGLYENIQSVLKGKYHFYTKNSVHTKNRRTILLISDSDNLYESNSYIDAWELSGDMILEYLQRSTKPDRSIKFGSFMLNGHRVKTVVPLIGFEHVNQKLKKDSPYFDEWKAMQSENV